MGEPREGDFPDPQFVRTENILLKTLQSGAVGNYARFNPTGTPAWEVVNTSLIPAQGSVLGEGFGQLQQDVNTLLPVVADGIANAGIFGPGSWFYGTANGTLKPHAYVMLGRIGTKFGFKSTFDITTGSAVVSSNVITISTISPHHLKVGDSVVTTGFTPSAFNATLTVASVLTSSSFTASLTTGDAPATVQGLVSRPVTGEFAHAQLIKKSGATFSSGAVINDICIFSMLSGGQPIA